MPLSISRLALLGLAALALAAPGLAVTPAAAETIHACVKANSGNVRILRDGQSCNAAETPLSWSGGASLTCPAGTTLSIGVCIEDAARAAAPQRDAALDCAGDGRRLPTTGELLAFRELPGVTLTGNGEWADDLAVADLPNNVFTYLVVSDVAIGYDGAAFPNAYRCVAGPAVE